MAFAALRRHRTDGLDPTIWAGDVGHICGAIAAGSAWAAAKSLPFGAWPRRRRLDRTWPDWGWIMALRATTTPRPALLSR